MASSCSFLSSLSCSSSLQADRRYCITGLTTSPLGVRGPRAKLSKATLRASSRAEPRVTPGQLWSRSVTWGCGVATKFGRREVAVPVAVAARQQCRPGSWHSRALGLPGRPGWSPGRARSSSRGCSVTCPCTGGPQSRAWPAPPPRASSGRGRRSGWAASGGRRWSSADRGRTPVLGTARVRRGEGWG